jgi:hypothetical protein
MRGMRGRLGLASAAALFTLEATPAAADVPFVDRPVTLSPLHVSADVGVGFGQWDDIEPDPNNLMGTVDLGNKVGFGSSLEAAVGLPFVGEFGARVGYRFDSIGANAQADHFARLFDPVVNEPGNDAFTNPELFLRGTLFALPMVELAVETRAIIPTASGTDFSFTVGLPVRIHIPSFARIDTGIYLPIAFSPDPVTGSPDSVFAIQIPAQLFFQFGDSFVGPLTGLLFTQNGGDPNPQIVAGVGGGHTFGALFDLKAQLYTSQINDVTWTKHIGGGLGVGLRL